MLTKLSEWQVLIEHHRLISDSNMREWFAKDQDRAFRFSLKVNGILLDYSRNRINDETLGLLFKLAQAVQLPKHIQALFEGHPINVSEKRPALHTALRDKAKRPIWVKDENIAAFITHAKERTYDFVDQIHDQRWRGATGQPITDIINVGIGGSYLGPMMAVNALKDSAVNNLRFHFISGVDPIHVQDVLKNLNPENSLFIISSKSFSTLETLTNLQRITNWMKKKLGQVTLKQHIAAVTSVPERAIELGIAAENIFPIWDWVGGRYSIWSAIGLPVMLMIGKEKFEEFLEGAHQMDQHFLHADLEHNMPVILALLGIWYINFFHSPVYAVIPYFHRLRYLIPYLQQADMESNGKMVSQHGTSLPYMTGPILFGEEGSHAQHAYHQLLHQGKHLIPVDFILPSQHCSHDHENILLASGLSQAEALLHGKSYAQTVENLRTKYPEAYAKQLALHQMMPGNKPSNLIFLDEISPYVLGALLALYEHKIYTQGVIWNINSFDQWGVELGKQLLPNILQEIQTSIRKQQGS
jgi:glucose-6-phosphate isomerase